MGCRMRSRLCLQQWRLSSLTSCLKQAWLPLRLQGIKIPLNQPFPTITVSVCLIQKFCVSEMGAPNGRPLWSSQGNQQVAQHQLPCAGAKPCRTHSSGQCVDSIQTKLLLLKVWIYFQIKAGAEEIAVFGAASESFSRKNINCSVEESIKRFSAVVTEAQKNNIRIRGYVSCVCGCPYEGPIDPVAVAKVNEKKNLLGYIQHIEFLTYVSYWLQVTEALFRVGCYEVSLGDTIGVGTAGSIGRMLREVSSAVPIEHLALHCHDTYGQALANILRGIEVTIQVTLNRCHSHRYSIIKVDIKCFESPSSKWFPHFFRNSIHHRESNWISHHFYACIVAIEECNERNNVIILLCRVHLITRMSIVIHPRPWIYKVW